MDLRLIWFLGSKFLSFWVERRGQRASRARCPLMPQGESMRLRVAFVVVALTLFCAPSLRACEPILPFLRVAGGPITNATSSLALLLAVFGKSLVFATLQKRLSWWRAFLYMLEGNVVSSLVGVIAAALIGATALFFIGIPFVAILAYVPAKRFCRAFPRWAPLDSPALVAFLLSVGLGFSCFLFIVGQAAIAADRLSLYWAIKLAAIDLALVISIILSAFWEEWTVSSQVEPNSSDFVAPIVRANVAVLLVVMLIAAVMMFPQRARAWQHLVQLCHRTAKVVATSSMAVRW